MVFLICIFMAAVSLLRVSSQAKVLMTTKNVPTEDVTGNLTVIEIEKKTLQNNAISDSCDPNPCKNNGICIYEEDDLSCICDEFFFGQFCDKSSCDPNPCLNHGTCKPFGNTKHDFFCECIPGYEGEMCETVNTESTPSVTDQTESITSATDSEKCDCYNGYCDKDESGEIVCKCLPEYGKLGPTYCTECFCGEGANCTFDGGLLIYKSCICKEGYRESFGICKDVCDPNPCFNNGTCKPLDNMKGNFICECKNGYNGERCEIAQETCQCENGYCEMDSNGKMVCQCPPEWGLLTSIECKRCNCGKESNCTFAFFHGGKICTCKEGYRELNGVCSKEEHESTTSFGTTRNHAVCDDDICKNGGICSEWCGEFGCEIRCRCQPTFSGKFCELEEHESTTSFGTTRDHAICYDDTCKNGGICSKWCGEFGCEIRCRCQPTFTGKFCELEDYGTSESPATTTDRENRCFGYCFNGGICKEDFWGFPWCYCKFPFIGERCKYPVSQNIYGRNTVIVVVSVSLVAIAAIAAVMVWCCIRNRKAS